MGTLIVSLTPPLYIGVTVTVASQESDWSCICVGVSILPLSTIFVVDFGTLPTFYWKVL